MTQASVAELKAKLSQYLATVKAGEEVVVTDRGRPVARLAPLAPEAAQDAHMQGLIRRGIARPPTKPLPADFWDRPRPKDPEGRMLRALLEEREHGR